MSAFTLLPIAILCGLLTVLSLVFLIISIARSKTKPAIIWGVVFVLAIGFCLFCIVQFARAVRSGAEQLGDSIEQKLTEVETNQNNLKTGERQEFLTTLQASVNEKHEGQVPADFYANTEPVKDSYGRIIAPFLFPFKMRYDETTLTGDIILNEQDTALVRNVTEMAFDKNFVIAKVDNRYSQDLLTAGRGEIEYVFFDLRTAEYEAFPNKELLMKIAGKIGYTGPEEMTSLSTSYRGWTGPLDFNF